MTILTGRRPLVLLLGVFSVGLAGCGAKSNAVLGADDPMAKDADQVMWTARLKLTDAGVNRAEVHADTAYFFDENTRVEMRGVHTVFFTDAGAKNADLTSRQGTYNSRTGNMEARGNAYVVAVDGRTLRSPVLDYDQVRNIMSSDSVFTATDSTGRRLDGIGFTSDPDMTDLHCFKNCHGIGGQIILPESGHPAATSDTTHRAGAAPPGPPPPPPPPPPSPTPASPPHDTTPGGRPKSVTLP
ncbi:MAG TPA: LPS export ABC transporter periplasmic protein LptC [Gemmatimonadaceae bacterium]|jgi:LPS export ABC transporter protein LptC|nr:LPS export ABC transporter periplasmic protein LptC [Gemmatimonadaceae bacterium]